MKNLLTTLAIVTAACSAAPARSPTGPQHDEPGMRWDESMLLETNGHAWVLAGPVYHLANGENAPGAISHRCLALAQGIPDLTPLAAEHDATEPLFTARWLPEAALERDRCVEAYGPGWRLPTLEEARAAMATHRMRWGLHTLLTRESAGASHTLRRDRDPCYPFDHPCGERMPISTLPIGPAEIYCIAPAALRPPSDAPREELASSIARVEQLLAPIAPRPMDLVDAGALDFVLAARAACMGQARDQHELVELLRQELGTTGAWWRTGELQFELESSKERAHLARSALAALTPPLMVDCQAARTDYEKFCWQDVLVEACFEKVVTFSSACIGFDPKPDLEATARALEERVPLLERRLRRQYVVFRALGRGLECRDDASSPLHALHGKRFERPHPCGCELTELDCALRALRDRFDCKLAVPRPPLSPLDLPPLEKPRR